MWGAKIDSAEQSKYVFNEALTWLHYLLLCGLVKIDPAEQSKYVFNQALTWLHYMVHEYATEGEL